MVIFVHDVIFYDMYSNAGVLHFALLLPIVLRKIKGLVLSGLGQFSKTKYTFIMFIKMLHFKKYCGPFLVCCVRVNPSCGNRWIHAGTISLPPNKKILNTGLVQVEQTRVYCFLYSPTLRIAVTAVGCVCA